MENRAGSASLLSSLVSHCPGELQPSLPAKGILPVVQPPQGSVQLTSCSTWQVEKEQSEAGIFPSGWGLLNSPGIGHRIFSEPLLQCLSPPSPGEFGQLHPQPDSAQAAPHPLSLTKSCEKHPSGDCAAFRGATTGPAGVALALWGPVSSGAPQHCGLHQVAQMSTQSQRFRAMLRNFACPQLLTQCPPPLPKGDAGLQGGLEQQPLLHQWDASSQGGGGGLGGGGWWCCRRGRMSRWSRATTPEPFTPSTGCFSAGGWKSGSTGGARGLEVPPRAGDPCPCPPGW